MGGLLRLGSWGEISSLIEGYYLHSPIYGVVGYKYYTYTQPAVVRPTTTGASATAPGYTGTNVHVAGVDEDDVVKTNGTHIFIARGGNVLVYRAYPPSRLSLALNVSACSYVESHTEATGIALVRGSTIVRLIANTSVGACRVRGLHVLGDGGFIAIVEAWMEPSPLVGPRTWILRYSPSGRILWSYWVSGDFLESRLPRGGPLLVATVERAALTLPGRVSVVKPEDSEGVLPASRVYIAGEPVYYTLISSIDTGTGRAYTAAVLGPHPEALYMPGPGRVYVALVSRLYYILLRHPYPYTTAPSFIRTGEYTVIVEFNATPTLVEPVGTVNISGVVGSQWQLNTYKGYLLVVDSHAGNVSLYVVNASSLRVEAELSNIAVRESVRAVRLVDGILYLVTTRVVDPLFAVNVTDPLHPRVIGYLKSPGFDAYIHPVAPGRILGIGYEGGALRVTLYDVSNATPRVLQRLYLKGATSPVIFGRWGYKAFTYDPRHHIALIPVAERTGRGTQVLGVAVILVGGDTLKLIEILDHYHSNASYIPWCATIGLRVIVIGDYAYTASALPCSNPPSPARLVPPLKAWSLGNPAG